MGVNDEPAVKNVIAFFDGQNLFQHAKEAFGYFHPNYDPIKLHKAVCDANKWRRTLTRFYTGIPSQIEDKMWAAYWSNRVLALKRAGVVVTTRPLRYRRAQLLDDDGNPIVDSNGEPKVVVTPQEKGIDVRLALDLVSAARTKQYDIALVFSQDQDLQEVVQEVADIAKEQDRWIRILHKNGRCEVRQSIWVLPGLLGTSIRETSVAPIDIPGLWSPCHSCQLKSLPALLFLILEFWDGGNCVRRRDNSA